ncbi:MAG: ABC transporter substrate-binding protein [Methanomassiliicoccales archaeon]|nr:ABC transporter substrate-binding protein [Methanomassiliicoccales archaeon]
MKPNPAASVFLVVAIVVIGIAAAGCLGPSEKTEKVVYWVTIAPKDQKVAIQRGDVDGGVSWEPYVSDSLLGGTGRVLEWSGDVWPNHPCCVVAADKSFAQSHPNLVMRVLKAHIEANRWIADAWAHPGSANYTLLLEIGAKFSNRNDSVVAAAMGHMTLDYRMNEQFIAGLKMFTETYITLKQIDQSKLSARGYSSVNDFVANYVDGSYLASADSVLPSDVIVGDVRMAYLTGDLHQFARVVAENRTVGGGQTLFEKFGVRTIDPLPGGYPNGGGIMTAFAGKAADMGYLGSPPAILVHLNSGVNTIIVAQANSEGSAIIVNPSIHNYEDLEGKTIATPGASSIQHLLFLKVAEDHGFTVKLKPS